MPQSSENLQRSLQLVQTEVDGNQVLAGRGEILGRPFNMVTRHVDGLLLFNFDLNDPATQEVGIFALLSLLDQLTSDQCVVMGTPGSTKSEEWAQKVFDAYYENTGGDHRLYIFQKLEEDPRLRDEGYKGKVEAYVPVTAPNSIRYLVMNPEQEAAIRQAVENGALVILLDDIVSTGETMKALGRLFAQIGVPIAHRFAVGAEVPATLVEMHGDELVWEPKEDVGEPKVEVVTAFTLPLFAGEDVEVITNWS